MWRLGHILPAWLGWSSAKRIHKIGQEMGANGMSKLGQLQVYTGDGKGKTTAAVGLAVRAAGAGLRVFFGQFLKDGSSCEFRILAGLPKVVCRFFGHGKFLRGRPSPQDRAMARAGLNACAQAIASGKYDVVIMDEACTAVGAGVIKDGDLLAVIRPDPKTSDKPLPEVVVTGRRASSELRAAADLVTDLREAKHYFAAGVSARKGIEY